MACSKIGASAAVGTTNRTKDDVNPISGLCGACVDTCIGLCEVGMSAIRGPEAIYPKPFGDITAAAVKKYPVDWSDFNIMGTAVGAHGVEADSDKAIFPNVNVEMKLGAKNGKPGLKLRLPFTVPGLGSTKIAKKHWDGLASGTALAGVLLTIGENVVGMDKDAKIENGKVVDAPDLKWRIATYKKWQQQGYGAIICQENVEDSRLGVLEYALKLGVDGVELKWGQGAKDIGGEVKIKEIEKAQLLKKRGYVVLPDPSDPGIVEAFKKGAFKEFERHSRLGMVSEEGFAKRVEELRKAGAKYVFLKTGAYRFADLARAVAFCSKYKIDVLTVDAAGGGTGMSPWRMMNEWGTPPIETFTKLYEYADKLAKKGKHVPDIVVAGGFSLEDHAFKGLAFLAPHVKAIGMARSPLTSVMASTAYWKRNEGKNKEEVYYGAARLKHLIGDKIKDVSPGGLGCYTYYMRLEQGLRQLMAGSRKFNLADDKARPDRNDLVALTKEAAAISGITYIMDNDKKEVEEILSKP
ncbi:FMN-binding glutamate synthase family protein [Candidatus Woesearchaeota archaeon]|nr:FMN-binding glutamate synthase family protein [Candidatus Woesearchaeota archaeon]